MVTLLAAADTANSSPLPLASPVFTSDQIMTLAWIASIGVIVMWLGFWIVVVLQKETVSAVLLNPSFFKTVAVIGVIAATAVLSLAQRLDGPLTGAIPSGTVGYVLGSLTGRDGRT